MSANLSTKVNRPYLPEDGGGLSCEVTIDPGSQDDLAERHVAICVDSSGSMDNLGKVEQVRDATNLVFGLLNEDDYLSIVSFDTDVQVVMQATRWGDIERDEAEEKVERIQPRGGTDIFAGLQEAAGTLDDLGGGEGVSKRILLLSDGRDTRRNAPDFVPLAEDIADHSISVYSAGIGTHYDKQVIRTIGEHSQGKWVHVTNPADIRSFFGDVVQDASTVIANNPKLRVETTQGVEVVEALRRQPQVQDIDLEYDDDLVTMGLPDLQDEEVQTVVMKMDAPGGDVGTRRKLATLELESDTVSGSADVSIEYSDDPEELAQQDDDVFLTHRDTVIRSRIAHAEDDKDIEDVKALVDETEVVADDTQVVADLRDTVTRIEEGDEEEIREVQEKTTVVTDESRLD